MRRKYDHHPHYRRAHPHPSPTPPRITPPSPPSPPPERPPARPARPATERPPYGEARPRNGSLHQNPLLPPPTWLRLLRSRDFRPPVVTATRGRRPGLAWLAGRPSFRTPVRFGVIRRCVMAVVTPIVGVAAFCAGVAALAVHLHPDQREAVLGALLDVALGISACVALSLWVFTLRLGPPRPSMARMVLRWAGRRLLLRRWWSGHRAPGPR